MKYGFDRANKNFAQQSAPTDVAADAAPRLSLVVSATIPTVFITGKEIYMIDCRFELNNKPMSIFWCGATRFPAFSGLGNHVNSRTSACNANAGPIPPGQYYIFDRQVGGLRGPFDRLFGERRDWFALYAVDGKIDDETYCDRVRRGEFRLHPKGDLGISLGCITIDRLTDFQFLRTILTSAKPSAVLGSTFKAYGKVWVR